MVSDVVMIDPKIGDTMQCPGCKEELTFDWADGWSNRNGLTCEPTNTTHTEHITTITLDAYYYHFTATGVPFVDKILGAVAEAGNYSHHTESWTDDGMTDSIQAAADAAAAKFIARIRELESSREDWIIRFESLSRGVTKSGVHVQNNMDILRVRATRAEDTIVRVNGVLGEYLDPEDADIECREDVWRFIRDIRAALEGGE